MESKVEEREVVTLLNEEEKIFGVLHRPLSTEKCPAVLICPGFAGNKAGKFRVFVTLAKELAKQGIAVLRFDYRGAGDSEGEFKDITIESKVSDTLKAIQFLALDPQIDASRLGVMGRSLGGAIAVLATKRHGGIKSLVLWAPVFHSEPWKQAWLNMQHNPKGATSSNFKHVGGALPSRIFLEEFFNLQLEEELLSMRHVPILHLHGTLDEVVKIEHAYAYKQALQHHTKKKFMELAHCDHDFSDFNEQKIAIVETCQWYQHTL